MTDTPTNHHSHLWNDLPPEERKRLQPFLIEQQMLHVWQAKMDAIRAHRALMRTMNGRIRNLRTALRSAEG